MALILAVPARAWGKSLAGGQYAKTKSTSSKDQNNSSLEPVVRWLHTRPGVGREAWCIALMRPARESLCNCLWLGLKNPGF